MRPSQKHLFTKITLPHELPAENAAESIIQGVLKQTEQEILIKHLDRLRPRFLTEEFMVKEANSMDQAYKTLPKDEFLCEDHDNSNILCQVNRPFSAKISRQTRHSKQPVSKITTKKLLKKATICNMPSIKSIEIKSSQNKGTRRYILTKASIAAKFIPLDCSKIGQNKEEESYLDYLRGQKAKQEEIQKSKLRFIKEFVQEQEKYPKLNKKFTQVMGNKQIYYTKNGQSLEVPHNVRGSKKMMTHYQTPLTKSQQTKDQSKRQFEQLVVTYRDKDTVFKKSLEAYNIQDRPKLIFYKSQNCNYQVLN